jgi:hypothetical protein
MSVRARFGAGGEGSQGALVAITLLIIALLLVFFLWMNDRRSQDADLEIDIGQAPDTVQLSTIVVAAVP